MYGGPGTGSDWQVYTSDSGSCLLNWVQEANLLGQATLFCSTSSARHGFQTVFWQTLEELDVIFLYLCIDLSLETIYQYSLLVCDYSLTGFDLISFFLKKKSLLSFVEGK